MKQDHSSIDISEDVCKNSTIDMQDDLSKWEKYSIYRIPYHIRRKKEEAYEPKLVSIGPYHRDNKQLKRMDEHKARSLDTFVSRSCKTRGHYEEALRNTCKELMPKYQHLHERRIISEAEFIKVMLTDGCFLIEVMRALCEKPGGRYNADDPIFCLGGIGNIWFDLISDLLLVENQIPIDVLVELVKVEGQHTNEFCKARKYVCQLACKFLGLDKKLRTDKHLLDLRRQNFVGIRKEKQAVGSGKLGRLRTVQTAMEYHMSGIRFERGRDVTSRMTISEIEMTENTLRLPTLIITKVEETVLINLVAYEHLCPALAPEVSSYISFMAGLLQTDEDVGLLQSRELIQADIASSSAEIPRVLSRIDRCIVTRQWTDLGKKIDDLNAFWFLNKRKKKLNYWIKGFKDVYFKNPWSAIGLLAGVVALALTLDSTIIANLGYFNGHKN